MNIASQINPDYISPELILDLFTSDLEISIDGYYARVSLFEDTVTVEPDLLDLVQASRTQKSAEVFAQVWAMIIRRHPYFVVALQMKFFPDSRTNYSSQDSSDLYDFAVGFMEKVGLKDVTPLFNLDDYHFAERNINGKTYSFFVYVPENLAY